MGCCLWILRLQCMIWTSLSVLMICMDIRLEMKTLVAVSEAVQVQIMRGRDSGPLGRGRVYRHHETE